MIVIFNRPVFSSEFLIAHPNHLILWLLEQQPPPLHLFQTADAEWWSELRRHRLTPLLYVRLERAGLTKDLQPAVAKLLRHDYAAALKLSLAQEAEAHLLLSTLKDAGIEAILLKGADLRLRLYEDPATRPMSDLDLLVAPESLGAVAELLESFGYTISDDSVNPRPRFRERFRVGLHFKALPPASLMVDLHWGLEGVAGYYRLPYAHLASQTQILDWQGMAVRVLSPEHSLMHLCIHYYDEGDLALKLVDLCLALTRLPLNWDLFLREVADCRCQAPILIVLQGLAELLPGAVPLRVLEKLGNYVPGTMERLVLRRSQHSLARLLGPLSHQRRPSAWVAYMAALLWPDPVYLKTLSGSPGRLAYLVSSLEYLFSRRG